MIFYWRLTVMYHYKQTRIGGGNNKEVENAKFRENWNFGLLPISAYFCNFAILMDVVYSDFSSLHGPVCISPHRQHHHSDWETRIPQRYFQGTFIKGFLLVKINNGLRFNSWWWDYLINRLDEMRIFSGHAKAVNWVPHETCSTWP